jgi:hypothetical protein
MGMVMMVGWMMGMVVTMATMEKNFLFAAKHVKKKSR